MGPIVAAFLTSFASKAGNDVAGNIFGGNKSDKGGPIDFAEIFNKKKKPQEQNQMAAPAPASYVSPATIMNDPILLAFMKSTYGGSGGGYG